MALGFKPVDREQQFLLPPDVREWLPEGHLARFVISMVEGLDLDQIRSSYRLGGRGRQAYDPAMLTGLLLYAYAIGVTSSRVIERACETDVAFRVIAANQAPDHNTIARFRAGHELALAGLFGQVLGLCVRAGLVDARTVAVDSTRVAANASGAANLTREQLQAHARRVLDQAARDDTEEDERYGPHRRGDEPTEGWEDPSLWPEKIKAALAELEVIEHDPERAAIEAINAERAAKGWQRAGPKLKPADPERPWRVASQQARPKKVNVTDPQSRNMKTPGGWVQGYSAQAVTTADQIIVAADVTNQHNDGHQLAPMLDQSIGNLERAGSRRKVRTALADTGYFNSREIERVERDLHVGTLVATGRDRDVRAGQLGKAVDATKQKMTRRLSSRAGRERYRRRSQMIEPVFGDIKANRGFRRFSRRGLDAAKSEWSLTCTAHNIRKLFTAACTAS